MEPPVQRALPTYAINRPAVMAPTHNSSELTASTLPSVDTAAISEASVERPGRNTARLIHTMVTTPRVMHAILTMNVGFDSLAGAITSSAVPDSALIQKPIQTRRKNRPI